MQQQKSQDPRDETEDERDDRNLAELLQELRVGRPRRAGDVRLPALAPVHHEVLQAQPRPAGAANQCRGAARYVRVGRVI